MALESISQFLNNPIGGVVNDPGGLGSNLGPAQSGFGALSPLQLLGGALSIDQALKTNNPMPFLQAFGRNQNNQQVFSLPQLTASLGQQNQQNTIESAVPLIMKMLGFPG